MDAVKTEQPGQRVTGPLDGPARARSRHPHRRAVLRRACSASRAPRSSRSSSPAAATSCARSGPFVDTDADGRPGTRCSGRSKGAAARASRSTCARPTARTCSAGSRRPPTSSSRTSGPARSSSGTSARRPRSAPRHRAHLDVRPGRAVLAAARPRPRRHRLRRPAAPHRLSRPAAGARRRHDLRLPHRRVRRAGRGRPRSTRATRAAATGAVIDAALYGAVAAHPRVDARRRTTGSASCASREGNRLANSAPLDNYPTARRQVRVHRRRLRRELLAAVQGDGPARPARRPALRQARRPRRARRRDQRHRRRVDGDARRRATIEARCVAHDVPGRDRVHRGRHLRRPAHRGARRSRDGRRSGRSARCASRRRSRAASASRRRRRRGAPRLGAHTDEVLDDLLGIVRRRARRRCATNGVV